MNDVFVEGSEGVKVNLRSGWSDGDSLREPSSGRGLDWLRRGLGRFDTTLPVMGVGCSNLTYIDTAPDRFAKLAMSTSEAKHPDPHRWLRGVPQMLSGKRDGR